MSRFNPNALETLVSSFPILEQSSLHPMKHWMLCMQYQDKFQLCDAGLLFSDLPKYTNHLQQYVRVLWALRYNNCNPFAAILVLKSEHVFHVLKFSWGIHFQGILMPKLTYVFIPVQSFVFPVMSCLMECTPSRTSKSLKSCRLHEESWLSSLEFFFSKEPEGGHHHSSLPSPSPLITGLLMIARYHDYCQHYVQSACMVGWNHCHYLLSNCWRCLDSATLGERWRWVGQITLFTMMLVMHHDMGLWVTSLGNIMLMIMIERTGEHSDCIGNKCIKCVKSCSSRHQSCGIELQKICVKNLEASGKFHSHQLKYCSSPLIFMSGLVRLCPRWYFCGNKSIIMHWRQYWQSSIYWFQSH